MLYEDKYGALWCEEDVNMLAPSKILELQIHQYVGKDEELFD